MFLVELDIMGLHKEQRHSGANHLTSSKGIAALQYGIVFFSHLFSNISPVPTS